MNGKRIKWQIIISTKNTAIRTNYKYGWAGKSSPQDRKYVVETRLSNKLAFRYNTI